MTQPSVAIVILNWNGKKFLEKFLPSVTASAYPNPQDAVHKKITESSVDALSATIIFLLLYTDAKTEGRNCSKNFLPFQFKITIATDGFFFIPAVSGASSWRAGRCRRKS